MSARSLAGDTLLGELLDRVSTNLLVVDGLGVDSKTVWLFGPGAASCGAFTVEEMVCLNSFGTGLALEFWAEDVNNGGRPRGVVTGIRFPINLVKTMSILGGISGSFDDDSC
jgi:hypothetical protein